MPTFRLPVDLEWSGASGSPGVNVWHARTDDFLAPFEDVEAVSEFIHQFYQGLVSLLPSTMTCSFAGEVQGVGAAEGQSARPPSWSVTGTAGTDFLPPSQCLLAQWRTDSGGRNGRGRTFIGPLSGESLQSNGSPDEGVRTQIETLQANLIESSDSFGNGAVGIWSRTEGIFRDLTAGSCPNYFAVLRSRRD